MNISKLELEVNDLMEKLKDRFVVAQAMARNNFDLMTENKRLREEIHQMCEATSKILRDCDYEDESIGGGPTIERTYYVPMILLQEIIERKHNASDATT